MNGLMKFKKIQTKYCTNFKTLIRNKETLAEDLRIYLNKIGCELGKEISEEFETQNETIITPLEEKFSEKIFLPQINVIISTKDDYPYLNEGINSTIVGTNYRGYMNFNGIRGIDALTAEIRDIKLPLLKHQVDNLIIAKTVLASSCTAISLAERAYEEYRPKNLIFSAIFYSEYGIKELFEKFPQSKILVVDEPDQITENGMLIPGLGDIDERIKDVA